MTPSERIAELHKLAAIARNTIGCEIHGVALANLRRALTPEMVVALASWAEFMDVVSVLNHGHEDREDCSLCKRIDVHRKALQAAFTPTEEPE